MSIYNTLSRRSTCGSTACILVLLASSAVAAPSIQNASGTFSHKNTVTITGSGFGTKATAAPVVWDDASTGTVPTNGGMWNGYWPYGSPTSNYNVAYRTPIRGITLPHNNITRYIAGAHGDNSGWNAGGNVILFKNRVISSYPAYTYASWYQRMDDGWTYGRGSPGDDNLKIFDFSSGSEPYSFPANWYIEYNPRPTSRSNIPYFHLNDDATGSPQATLQNSGSWWMQSAVNPMAGAWSKIELEIRYTNQTDGYIKIWENGVSRGTYNGPTDRFSGTSRSEGIGGFARSIYSTNWRYFADVYLDYSVARIILANNSDLNQARVIETQIPSNWSDGSISFNVNLGQFSSGQTAYLFVFDATGQRNISGFPVIISANSQQISSPSELKIITNPSQ